MKLQVPRTEVLSLKPAGWKNSGELKTLREKNQWEIVRLKEHTHSICWICHTSTETAKLEGDMLKDLRNLTNIPSNEPDVCKDGCRTEYIFESMDEQ